MKYNINTVFFSPTDRTKMIVKEIAKQLDPHFTESNITAPKNRKAKFEFDENDVVIVGAPVYSGRIPQFIETYYKTFKGNNTVVIPIVLYGNRQYEDALLEMKDIFSERGFITIAGGAFIGQHAYTKEVAFNRPDADDLNIAKTFGMDIKKKLQQIRKDAIVLKDYKLEVKGNFPYRERKPTLPLGPKTLDSCIDCGICSVYCPSEAISKENFKIINEDKCIKCFSCVKICPTESKYFDERLNGVKKWLIDNHAEQRKEPELFL